MQAVRFGGYRFAAVPRRMAAWRCVGI